MNVRQSKIATALLLALMWLMSVLVWSRLPETMIVHWNASGDPDGLAGKLFGAFLVPLIASVLAIVLFALPKIDPITKGALSAAYGRIIAGMVAFFAVIHMAVLAWNVGVEVDFARVLGPSVGFLFLWIGFQMPKLPRNWFAGVRTPWSLSSDEAWQATHRAAGRVFLLAGAVSTLSLFFPEAAFLLVIVSALAVVFFSLAYSYWVYRKMQRTAPLA